jgi:hypothetical protein
MFIIGTAVVGGGEELLILPITLSFCHRRLAGFSGVKRRPQERSRPLMQADWQAAGEGGAMIIIERNHKAGTMGQVHGYITVWGQQQP